MKARTGLAALLILNGCLVSGCASRPARDVQIVAAPRESEHHHHPELSRIAAERIREEIADRGLAAIVDESKARPESVRTVDAPDGTADLVCYVWVQQVDLPRYPEGDDHPRVWGGFDVRNSDDERLAHSESLLVDHQPGTPSSALFVVADPKDPRARATADAFGARVVGAPGRFLRALNKNAGEGKRADR